ncbi:hypothetical protein F5146DRAFT_1005728 [Armillaria mellea]|nr:hypothetical protein F5146DRAFT_1005728 [Armillaria mellea]
MPHSLCVQGRFHWAGIFGMLYLYAGRQGYDESYWSGVGCTTNSVSFNFSKVNVIAVAGSTSGTPEYWRMAELMPLGFVCKTYIGAATKLNARSQSKVIIRLIYVLAGYLTVEA